MSLFSKILAWFWVTLLVIAVFFVVAVSLQFRLPLVPEFAMISSGKLQTIERQIAIQLSDSPRADWDGVLREYGALHGVEFIVTTIEGHPLAGREDAVPVEINRKISENFRLPSAPGQHPGESGMREGQPPPRPHGARGTKPPRRERDAEHPPHPKPAGNVLFMHTEKPDLYWFGMRTLIWSSGDRPIHAVLLAASPSMTGNGLFFDLRPWLVLVGISVILAGLLWLPFVRRLTRRVSGMMRAAESIGNGRFDVALDERGSDELARLGHAIKVMAQQLDGFVHGQKRFLGDVAHELGSPLARIQLGLGILEQKVNPDNRERVQDVLEDVGELSALVNELLEFTRADLKSSTMTLVPVALSELVERALARETDGSVTIENRISSDVTVLGAPDLLLRALANLLRNAVRYAGHAGPIELSATKEGQTIAISVRDHGPGVPEDELANLFKPFYRVESSRSRDTGGTGLGLAIVATCVEACRGELSAANAEGGGLVVTLTLKS